MGIRYPPRGILNLKIPCHDANKLGDTSEFTWCEENFLLNQIDA
jgi:hypothetical protein